MKQDELVFRVFNLFQAIESSTGMNELDLGTRALLWIIGNGEAKGAPLKVVDVIQEQADATAVTVYSRLSRLEANGWICSTADPNDGRAKRLRLTRKARAAFRTMSRCLSKELS